MTKVRNSARYGARNSHGVSRPWLATPRRGAPRREAALAAAGAAADVVVVMSASEALEVALHELGGLLARRGEGRLRLLLAQDRCCDGGLELLRLDGAHARDRRE